MEIHSSILVKFIALLFLICSEVVLSKHHLFYPSRRERPKSTTDYPNIASRINLFGVLNCLYKELHAMAL